MGLFGFLKSRPKWQVPEPRCIFMIACSAARLPAPSRIVHPKGEGEALPGTAGPEPRKTLEPGFLERPLRPGDSFMILSAGRGAFHVSVEGLESVKDSPARTLSRDAWPYVRLTEDLARRAREATATVVVMLVRRGQNLAQDVLFATRLADRISSLADGCVNDLMGCRFFGSGSWRVSDPAAEVDARDHVLVHAETGDPRGMWVHTHGLIKFGRPEIEVYEVAEPVWKEVSLAVLDLAMYLIGGAIIGPGETVGDPGVPLVARLGTRHRKGHWEDCPVLELVDVDENRKPLETGAMRGLEALLRSRGS